MTSSLSVLSGGRYYSGASSRLFGSFFDQSGNLFRKTNNGATTILEKYDATDTLVAARSYSENGTSLAAGNLTFDADGSIFTFMSGRLVKLNPDLSVQWSINIHKIRVIPWHNQHIVCM